MVYSRSVLSRDMPPLMIPTSCNVQDQSKQEAERLQHQLTEAQRSATAAAASADATIRDLQQQVATAQRQQRELDTVQKQAMLARQQQCNDLQQERDDAQQQLASVQQQLLTARARLVDAETLARTANQRAMQAESQAAALSGAHGYPHNTAQARFEPTIVPCTRASAQTRPQHKQKWAARMCLARQPYAQCVHAIMTLCLLLCCVVGVQVPRVK
jgi:DNA repair exonuclease SbcCD ATPase subunit